MKTKLSLGASVARHVKVTSSSASARQGASKRALLTQGSIGSSHRGEPLLAHVGMHAELADLLSLRHGYDEVEIVPIAFPGASRGQDQASQAHRSLERLFAWLAKAGGRTGFVSVVCHGGTVSSADPDEKGSDEHLCVGVSDDELTRMLSSVHKDSEAVVVLEACFADGMVDWHTLRRDQVMGKNNILVLSGARESGLNSSAYFTGDGGFMSAALIKVLGDSDGPRQCVSRDELQDALCSHYCRGDCGVLPTVLPVESRVRL